MAGECRKHPFLLPVEEVAEDLKTNIDKGLTSAQVTELQAKYPPNELDVGSGIAWYTIFIRQLCNAMILVCLPPQSPPTNPPPAPTHRLTHALQVLFFAMGLSFGVGDFIEGGVLAAVIVLNVSIGFFQEYGAEKKMDALRSLSAPSATVLRDGKTSVIPKLVILWSAPIHTLSANTPTLQRRGRSR